MQKGPLVRQRDSLCPAGGGDGGDRGEFGICKWLPGQDQTCGTASAGVVQGDQTVQLATTHM